MTLSRCWCAKVLYLDVGIQRMKTHVSPCLPQDLASLVNEVWDGRGTSNKNYHLVCKLTFHTITQLGLSQEPFSSVF